MTMYKIIHCLHGLMLIHRYKVSTQTTTLFTLIMTEVLQTKPKIQSLESDCFYHCVTEISNHHLMTIVSRDL